MGKDAPSVQKALAAAKSATTLRIHFPEATVSEAGKTLTISATKLTPTLSVRLDALGPAGAAAGKKYVVVSLDPDAPFPSMSFLGPVLHGLHIDVAPNTAAADADGFAPLEGPAAEWMVSYIPPGPPKPSSAHRYVFLLYEQPPGLDVAKVRGLLGLAEEVKLTARLWWSVEAAEKKLGLGEVLAANYWVTSPYDV
ncbi:PEBP-like protein [Xylaria palmicola]|nr:PEBP-like protein [Xylaria palmicola]